MGVIRLAIAFRQMTYIIIIKAIIYFRFFKYFYYWNEIIFIFYIRKHNQIIMKIEVSLIINYTRMMI